jgi:hypothetical protein
LTSSIEVFKLLPIELHRSFHASKNSTDSLLNSVACRVVGIFPAARSYRLLERAVGHSRTTPNVFGICVPAGLRREMLAHAGEPGSILASVSDTSSAARIRRWWLPTLRMESRITRGHYGTLQAREVGAVISGDHVQEMPSERAELHAVDHACARSGLDRPGRRKSAPAHPSEFREVGLPLIMALDCRRPWIRTSPTSINAFLGWSTIRGVANEPNLL